MARKQRPPNREGDLHKLRAQLSASIRKGSGVNVVMPQITTAQIANSRDLLQRFLEQPGYRPVDGLVNPTWFVHYEAVSGDLPESASVAWTKDLVDPVTLLCSGGICYITDASDTAAILYTYTADLDNAVGTTLEARVKVTTGDVAVNSGLLIRIEDGAQRWDVYCRTGDLNIDDGNDTAVSVDLTSFRWLRFAAMGTNLLVSVEGQRLCTGGPKDATTAELVGWGVTSSSLVSAQVRNVRGIAAYL